MSYKLKSDKVLRAIEQIVPNIPQELLYFIRYHNVKDFRITRKNLKESEISCSLQEFLDAVDERCGASDSAPIFLPFEGGQDKDIKLLKGTILLWKKRMCFTRLGRKLKVYNPHMGFDTTAETQSFRALDFFKEELIFFQNGEKVPFESLNEKKEIIAYTEKELLSSTHILIHYTPEKAFI